MAGLSDIVNVVITTQSAQVQQAGFGVPLILGHSQRFANGDVIRFYTDPSGLISDGFTVNDAEYLAAQAICSQTPRAPLFAVGRRALVPTMKYRLTPTATNLTTYKVAVQGAAASYTSDASATVAEITAGLKTAIDALSLAGVTTTDNATSLDVTITAGGFLTVAVDSSSIANLLVEQTNVDPGIATDLAAILLASSAWYAFVCTSASTAELTAAAAWCEANGRLFVQHTVDTRIVTASTADVASTLKTSNYARTAIIYHPENRALAGAAWLGARLPYTPGSETWKFASLKGVANVPLTPSQIANLKGKNANYYTDYAGISITGEGVVAFGEFVDVVRGRDWFASRLQTRLFTVLASQPKVPFTDGGIGQLEAEVRSQMREAIDGGFLTDNPAPIVVAPKASAVSTTDKQNRTLSSLTFTAFLAGAIHKATPISGVISL